MHYFLKTLHFDFSCFSAFNDAHKIVFNVISICSIPVFFISVSSVRFPLEIFQISTVTINYAVRTEGLQ
jgi:hypothetical protein